MSGLPKAMDPHEITPDAARALLAVPATIGLYTVSGDTILAGIGRAGSRLQHRPNYVSLPDDEYFLTIGLNCEAMLVDSKTA